MDRISEAVGIWGLVIGVLSFAWTIGYTVWLHRRRANRPNLFVSATPSVFFAGPKMYFRPKEGGKKTPLPPGAVLNNMVSIFAYNTGPHIITLNAIDVAPVHAPKKRIRLHGCWIAPDDSGTLPHVLHPGGKWEGLCDWSWLRDQLEQSFGPRATWNLKVIVTDINDATYSTVSEVADEHFIKIAQQGQQEIRERSVDN